MIAARQHECDNIRLPRGGRRRGERVRDFRGRLAEASLGKGWAYLAHVGFDELLLAGLKHARAAIDQLVNDVTRGADLGGDFRAPLLVGEVGEFDVL